ATLAAAMRSSVIIAPSLGISLPTSHPPFAHCLRRPHRAEPSPRDAPGMPQGCHKDAACPDRRRPAASGPPRRPPTRAATIDANQLGLRSLSAKCRERADHRAAIDYGTDRAPEMGRGYRVNPDCTSARSSRPGALRARPSCAFCLLRLAACGPDPPALKKP